MASTRSMTQTCAACDGSGVQPSKFAGPILREKREAAGLSREAVADQIGRSVSYLRDLELGQRKWSTELVRDYEKAVEELSGAPV